MTELLNPAQRSSLTVRLRAFEMTLRQADAWLQNDPDVGILYSYTMDLSPEQRTAVRAQIQVALAEIAHLAATFALVPHRQTFSNMLVAQMSGEWSSLCDVRADKLRRYGAVDPRLPAQLDPSIDTLIELAALLARLAAAPASL